MYMISFLRKTKNVILKLRNILSNLFFFSRENCVTKSVQAINFCFFFPINTNKMTFITRIYPTIWRKKIRRSTTIMKK